MSLLYEWQNLKLGRQRGVAALVPTQWVRKSKITVLDTTNGVSDCVFLYICWIKRHYIRKISTKLYACYLEYTQMSLLFEWPILQVAHSVRTARNQTSQLPTSQFLPLSIWIMGLQKGYSLRYITGNDTTYGKQAPNCMIFYRKYTEMIIRGWRLHHLGAATSRQRGADGDKGIATSHFSRVRYR